jgi:K+ transporter
MLDRAGHIHLLPVPPFVSLAVHQPQRTSAAGYGQIYVGSVNWLLMLVTLGLTIGFGKSDNLAAACGIAVSATMLLTSALLFIAMREIWGWSIVAAGGVAGSFAVVDPTFFVANLAKMAEGGYVPLVLAALLRAGKPKRTRTLLKPSIAAPAVTAIPP